MPTRNFKASTATVADMLAYDALDEETRRVTEAVICHHLNEAYESGVSDGESDREDYDDGHRVGRREGYDSGFAVGYAKGITQAQATVAALPTNVSSSATA